jgi:ABC-type multidrug transport system ATPase subunit
MTLILAPPGAGKSVLLRALSGRLQHDSGLAGELRYNGLTNEECRKRGIFVTRMASYVGQVRFLTERHTEIFGAQHSIAAV